MSHDTFQTAFISFLFPFLSASCVVKPGRGGGAARGVTCAFLAGEGEVVVAGDVVPLAVLVPDHHHAVLPRGEEAVGLVGSPVLVLLRGGEKRRKTPC